MIRPADYLGVIVSVFALGVMHGSLACLGLAQEPTGLQLAASLETVLVKTIEESEKSVVAIAVYKVGKDDAAGADRVPVQFATGVVIGSDGLILTNHHVLGQADNRFDVEYWITTSDRQRYKAQIKQVDQYCDLAVLTISASGLKPIQLGDASKLKKGQIVISLGNPHAIAADGQASASWGIVSNLTRQAGSKVSQTSSSDASSIHQLGTLIQTDAKLNLGTSGGPLLNLKGRMIGLTTSIASQLGYEKAAGYAIPVDKTFRRVVDTLSQGKSVQYGFLGVYARQLKQAEMRKGIRGVRIESVPIGTSASRSGLRAGDIVTHLNGQIIDDANRWVLLIRQAVPGETVRLSVLRTGGRFQLNAKLDRYVRSSE